MTRPPIQQRRQPRTNRTLIDEFTKLPGIGRRSAERLAFHVLKSMPEEASRLSKAIEDVKQNVSYCSICYNLTDADPCRICANRRADASLILVVEQPKDLISLEQTGMFSGVYHVLTGRLDPLSGVEPGHLTIEQLLNRIDHADATAARCKFGSDPGHQSEHGRRQHRVVFV